MSIALTWEYLHISKLPQHCMHQVKKKLDRHKAKVILNQRAFFLLFIVLFGYKTSGLVQNEFREYCCSEKKKIRYRVTAELRYKQKESDILCTSDKEIFQNR